MTTISGDTALEKSRSQAWSDYWRQGALHSLQGSYPLNYEGEIRTFWVEVFSRLAADMAVLDVGTGNGPLPAMLCERDTSLLPSIDAIDLATVSPPWFESAPAACRAAVRFHSRISVEQLPFAAEAYDLVISQYGLEYANLELAVPEIARVLRPSGGLAFVSHHAGSRVAAIAAEEVSAVRWLLSKSGPLEAAGALLPYLAIAANGEGAALLSAPSAQACRSTFNTAMRQMGERIELDAFPDLLIDTRARIGALVDGIMRQRLESNVATAALEALRRDLGDTTFRSSELLDHALDETDVRRVGRLLQAHGFAAPEVSPVRHGPHLLGWRFRATKAC